MGEWGAHLPRSPSLHILLLLLTHRVTHMSVHILLASGSATRADLLARAGIGFELCPARIDEAMVVESMTAEGEDVAGIVRALAMAKVLKISAGRPEALIIGADQMAELDGTALGKPAGREAARRQLQALSGRTHKLHTAAAVAEAGRIVWTQGTLARLTMRPLSTTFIEQYLDRNPDAVLHSCGGYRIEEEGVRLFSAIDGDFFSILGLPLLELLNFLHARGSVVS